MNYTRHDLIQVEATMNQMRNNIYHLARFMNKNGVTDINERLRRMGRNMGRTIYNYWKSIEVVTLSNVKDVMTTIYQKILGSSVTTEIKESEQKIITTDYKCAVCKYKYDDVDVSGCEIILGMVTEIVNQISKASNNPTAIFLELLNVKESKALGHKKCMLEYKYKVGGN